jgi:DNA-binding MarR family transcriptional regulator
MSPTVSVAARVRPLTLTGWFASATSCRLDRLEAAGWVLRKAVRDDRRSIGNELTVSGREIVDRAVTVHLANEVQLVAPLSPSQRKDLDGLLRLLLAHVEAASPTDDDSPSS